MNILEIIKTLKKSRVNILTFSDIKKLLDISADNTACKTIEKLVKKDVLKRLKKGLYIFEPEKSDDFETANYLYSPSYISLESALNHYGILPQFPFTITSVTLRKTKTLENQDKEFEFVHIKRDLFWGYEKDAHHLIATPEKALLDEIYFVAKGWRRIEFGDLDLSKINKKEFKKMADKINYLPFKNLIKKTTI